MILHLAKYLKLYILTLAIPLILSNLTVPLLGMTNVFIAGHLTSHAYLSALGLGDMVFDFLYWAFAFLRMGTTGLLANAFGAKDKTRMSHIITHSLGCALLAGVTLILTSYWLGPLIFGSINSSDEIITLAQKYFQIRIFAAPAVLVNFVCVGIFIGIQKPSKTLILMSLINGSAIVLALIFTQIWHLELMGIATADMIAQYLGAVYGLTKTFSLLNLKQALKNIQLDKDTVLSLLRSNRDIFIRTLCLIAAFSFFTLQGAALGSITLAANTVLMQFLILFAFAEDGFANVIETLLGAKIGAGDIVAAKRIFIETLTWSLVIASVFTLIYLFLGKNIIALLTSLPSVRREAHTFLLYACAIPLISAGCFFLDGAYIGANNFKQMRNMTCLALAGYFAVWYVCRAYGNHGLWLMFLSFFLLRTLLMGLRFCSSYFRNSFFAPQDNQ